MIRRAHVYRDVALLVDDVGRVWSVRGDLLCGVLIEQIGELTRQEMTGLDTATTIRKIEYLQKRREGLQ